MTRNELETDLRRLSRRVGLQAIKLVELELALQIQRIGAQAMTISPAEIANLKAEVARLAARLERIEAGQAAAATWAPVTEEMDKVGTRLMYSFDDDSSHEGDAARIYRAMARLAPEPEVSEAELVAVSKLLYPRDCTLAFVRDVVEAAREARIKASGR